MFFLAFLAIIGLIIAPVTLYAAAQAIQTDWLCRRDDKRYNKDRQDVLQEIIKHLDNLKHDNNDETKRAAVYALAKIADYLKTS